MPRAYRVTICLMVAGVTAAGLVLVGASLPAQGNGAFREHDVCTNWRRDCNRRDDCRYSAGDCGFRRGCYYGPAAPPPRHKWRPRPKWTPEKHAWRDARRPVPPARYPEREDCRYSAGDCGFRRGCYYGPAAPPPRHKWRPRPKWTPEKHAWRDAHRPAPPVPERRPAGDPERDVAASRSDQGEEDEGGATKTGETDGMRPRRKAAANGEIPERYRDMRNEVGHTLTAIGNGAPLYREHCAACHGAAGEGDGPRAQEAGPSLPALSYTLAQDDSTDAYLIWTIMQGGEPIGTDKPAFEDELSEQQAWQIIAYMRAGFPARGPSQAVRQTMQTQTGDDGQSAGR